MAVYSGYTQNTPNRLLLDAGAFFKNYNVASGAGTLLGATRGGGEFNAKPTIRPLEVDGVKGRAKGLNNIDEWEVFITANMLEITPDILKLALTTGEVDTASNLEYDVVTAKNTIAIGDYIDNIAWVGRLSGSQKPVIILIKNALSTEGIQFQTQDKNEAVLPITLYAHYDSEDLDTVPFEIYYPKVA